MVIPSNYVITLFFIIIVSLHVFTGKSYKSLILVILDLSYRGWGNMNVVYDLRGVWGARSWRIFSMLRLKNG